MKKFLTKDELHRLLAKDDLLRAIMADRKEMIERFGRKLRLDFGAVIKTKERL